MTNTDKWKEFVKWWEIFQQGIHIYTKDGIVAKVNNKLIALQKGDNAKQ